MARRDQPYLPLYVQDFITDEKLAECSAASTGVYIRIMCLMHKSEEYGTIALSNKDLSLFGGRTALDRFASKLIRHMPYDFDTIKVAIAELIEEKVLYIENNRLCQKRMIKDGQISIIRSKAGRKGADKTNSRYLAEANTPTEESPETPDKKLKYADNVKMTAVEYSKLLAEYGEQGVKRLIEILDNYKGANGKNYKSDYRAILNWVVDRYKNEQGNGSATTGKDTGTDKKGKRNYDEV